MFSKIFLFVSCIFAFHLAVAQADSLYVNGRFLYNNHQQQLVLKGVNYSVLDDWDFPANINNGGEKLVEIVKSGANAVRIQWYHNYGNATRPTYTLVHLDSLLTRCARYKMIAIVGLWDETCNNNYSNFTSSITNWLLQPAVIALFNKHKRYTIINPANEFGYYLWTLNAVTALQTFKNNYLSLTTTLRNVGYKIPIMIDAPDCGTNADALLSIGNELVTNDPLHNIMLSVHSYWQGYLNNDIALMNNKLTQMEQSGLPFILGEVANYQSDATPCQYSIAYQNILNTATAKSLGWLAWAWYKDYCNLREMTATGLYNNLGTFGLDIVNNATYGLRNTAIKYSQTFDPPITVLSSNEVQLESTCMPNNTIAITATLLNNTTGKIILQSFSANSWSNVATYFLSNQNRWSVTVSSSASYYRAIVELNTGISMLSNIQVNNCNENNRPAFFSNPAKDFITLTSRNLFNKATVLNLNGATMLKTTVQINTINISSLPSGSYILKLSSLQKPDIVCKLIVVK